MLWNFYRKINGNKQKKYLVTKKIHNEHNKGYREKGMQTIIFKEKQ